MQRPELTGASLDMSRVGLDMSRVGKRLPLGCIRTAGQVINSRYIKILF